MLINSILREETYGTLRAEIHQETGGYRVTYIGPTGITMKSENYNLSHDLKQVVEHAEVGLSSIRLLNE
ncbi:MAG: hypothetical protein WCY93_11085 [Anaerolineaceae bacterium]